VDTVTDSGVPFSPPNGSPDGTVRTVDVPAGFTVSVPVVDEVVKSAVFGVYVAVRG
jgi:hypothetical protein